MYVESLLSRRSTWGWSLKYSMCGLDHVTHSSAVIMFPASCPNNGSHTIYGQTHY